MRSVHTSLQKQKAIALRQKGVSYGEILKKLDIPSKGTLSAWFKDLQLSPAAKQKLERNIQQAYDRGFFKFNAERTQRVIKENKTYQKTGADKIGKISKRELLLVGAALYWGEGTKSQKGKTKHLSFSNSDPLMVKLFMRFVREILKVPEERIRAGIHLYKTIDEIEARGFWSGVTGLPKDRFYIHTQVSRASQGKRDWNCLPFGTVVIRVSNRKYFYTIIGMIEGLTQNI